MIIAFLFASLPQVSHKMRYRVLYAIAIIMLFAVIPISEYMAGDTQNSSNNNLLVLIFDIAVGYFCMYIAALLKFNVLKRKNQALENALTEKQQENVAILFTSSFTLLYIRVILGVCACCISEGTFSQSWAEKIFFDIIFVFMVNICLWVVW